MMRIICSLILMAFLVACGAKNQKQLPTQKVKSSNWDVYELEVFNERVKALFADDAEVEKLGEGFSWSEGPVWLEKQNKLLFTDVPNNVIYQWTKKNGVQKYLSPSGYSGEGEYSNEPGGNGLIIGQDGALYICQHGNRALAKMKAPVEAPQADFEYIVDQYNDKKLNSPNDLCQSKDGAIYFTDPPYGLPGRMQSAIKEQPYQGVYRWHPDEGVSLLIDSLSRPNGIALDPGGQHLYVANSDPQKAIWMKYNLNPQGFIYDGKVLKDATKIAATDRGLPDGLKIDKRGNVYATGPGGVWIFNSSDRLLGKIKVGQLISNCALDTNEEYLYLTADDYLLRVPLIEH